VKIDAASGSTQKILIHKIVDKFVGSSKNALISQLKRFIAFKLSI